MSRFPLPLFVICGAALAYLIWVAGSRHTGFPARAPEPQRRSTLDIPPGQLTKDTGVKIVNFYTATGTIARGDTALVCYSVLNAAAVRIAPPVAEPTPSISRCVQVSPRQTTTYRLDADGSDGSTARSSFELRVEPAPPRIEMLNISSKEIKRGERFDMCYTVKDAGSLRLHPPAVSVVPAEKGCYDWFPAVTTEYTLTAVGDRGRTDTLTFTVRVKDR
jgi:hypothetical protein